MPIKKDSKGLTIKQKKFVKAYVANDGNGTQAALETYDTTDLKTAGVISVENLARPSVREAIDAALVKHGITMDDAIKPIADGLHATRSISAGDEIYESVDHSIRLKASSMALKLMGADNSDQQVPAAVHFHQHITDKKSGYSF